MCTFAIRAHERIMAAGLAPRVPGSNLHALLPAVPVANQPGALLAGHRFLPQGPVSPIPCLQVAHAVLRMHSLSSPAHYTARCRMLESYARHVGKCAAAGILYEAVDLLHEEG